jgi:hypothetical protein
MPFFDPAEIVLTRSHRNKNVWGYGVSKFLTPWAEASGFRPPILTNMALITLWCACGIIFWFWGKKLRGITRNSFVHRL